VTGFLPKLKKAVKAESGQAIVEFAIVLPLLLILLLGILDFGWIFANQCRVQKAASAAARCGSINIYQYREGSTRQDYLNAVKKRAAENLPEGTETVLSVDGTVTAAAGTALVAVTVGRNNVSVTVSYPVRTLTFVAGILFGRYYPAVSTSVASC